jgi:hypothetical protein
VTPCRASLLPVPPVRKGHKGDPQPHISLGSNAPDAPLGTAAAGRNAVMPMNECRGKPHVTGFHTVCKTFGKRGRASEIRDLYFSKDVTGTAVAAGRETL